MCRLYIVIAEKSSTVEMIKMIFFIEGMLCMCCKSERLYRYILGLNVRQRCRQKFSRLFTGHLGYWKAISSYKLIHETDPSVKTLRLFVCFLV